MATKNEGTPITPERAHLGGLKAIVAGTMQIKQALALATTTKAREGVSLDDVRVRYFALGGPLWFRPVMRGELTWFMRQPGTARGNRHGTTHGCAHKAKKGATEQCIGGHDGKGTPCDFEFRSKGDGVTRWRNTPDAHECPAFDGDAPATVKAARATMRGYLATLAGMGFTAADMLATASIAQAIEQGTAETNMLPAKRVRKAKAKADAKAPEPAATTGN